MPNSVLKCNRLSGYHSKKIDSKVSYFTVLLSLEGKVSVPSEIEWRQIHACTNTKSQCIE